MTHMIDQGFIHERFPALSEITYLNTASTGIPPTTTIEAMKQYLDNKKRAIGNFKQTLDLLNETRSLLAQLLGGKRRQFGLVPSTSSGVNSFGHAISYPEGSNIVVCDLEFPANYIPWQNICKLYNVELRVTKSKEGAVPLEEYKQLVDENTRVLAVSHTQFGSGYKSDMKALSDLVHKHGGFVLCDIIQSAGWADINLESMDVDFATAQSAKWLIGPIGAGFVYVSEKIIDRLHPRFLGWWGVQELMEFGYSERRPLDDARMFQVGSPALITYVGLRESLNTLLEIDSKKRENVALSNGNYLRKRLSEIGIEYYEFGDKHNSPIVSCTPEEVDVLNEKLLKEKVFCSVRNGRLRISPHFYNTHQDIETVIGLLR